MLLNYDPSCIMKNKNLNYLLRITCLFLLFKCSQSIYAFDETLETDVRSLALGSTHSVSSVLFNPAFISFQEKTRVGISAISRFEMKELSTGGFYGIFPNRRLDAGISFATYGYEEYRLSQGEVSLAKKISSTFSIGIQFGCLYEDSFLKENTETFFFGDPGVYWDLHSKFKIAFITENLLSTSDFFKPAFYIGGIYEPTPNFRLFVENGFGTEKRTHFAIGIEYEILSVLDIRCGFRTDTPNPGIGASWKFDGWRIDATFLLHDKLNLSSGVGISYSW